MPAPLPLFPLNIPLVPGLVLPLHIFEPRYREMIEELLGMPDEDAREFGIVAVREGRDVVADGLPALYPVGTATILREAERHPDGRFDIVTTGSRRFRLLEVDTSRPLLRAQVEYLEDVSDPADALLAEQVVRRFRLYRGVLSGQVPDAVEWDDPDEDAGLPDDPTVLSYLVTAAMVLPADERQALLAASTTGDRLALARSLLGRETALISMLSAVPSLDVPGVTPSVN